MKSILLTILVCILSVQISNAQWVQVSNGMENITVWSLAYSGNNIFAGSGNHTGVYLSTNNGASWTQTSLNNQAVQSLAVNGNYVFAGTYQYGVYLSTNNGATWTQTSLNNRNVSSLAVSGNYIFAGTWDSPNSSVFLSTNNGTSWSQTSLDSQWVYSFAVSGNYIFAGTVSFEGPGNGVYLSTNNGTTWTQTSLNNRSVWSLAVNGNYIFAGTVFPGNGVYLSTNNGTTWTQTSLNNQTVHALAVNGTSVFAGTSGISVFMSNNNGASWIQRNEGLGNVPVYAFCILNNYIFAGTEGTGVYRRPLSELGIPVELISFNSSFTNNNVTLTWQTATETNNLGFQIERRKTQDERSKEWSIIGFVNGNGTTTEPQSYSFNDEDLQEGTYQYRLKQLDFDGTYKYYDLSETVGIGMIDKFELVQNYPNPFNPTTKIKFNIPKTTSLLQGGERSGLVTLKVYDVLGNEVATLVNEEKSPGTYEVKWNAEELSSGVYYYTLIAGNFTQSRKLMLMK